MRLRSSRLHHPDGGWDEDEECQHVHQPIQGTDEG
jgi:hypothetical protein